MRRLLVASLLSAFSLPMSAKAVLTVEYNALVSEWSSSTPLDPTNGIYPIGGSGQINQNFFVISERTDPNDPSTMVYQVGARAAIRFSATPAPTNSPPPGTPPFSYPPPKTPIYYVPPGEFGGPGSGEALWTFDIHIDLRPSGLELSDFDPVNSFFSGPGLGTVTLGQILTDLPGFSNGRLIQIAFNPNTTSFPFFDPNAFASYSLSGALVPLDPTFPTIAFNGIVNAVPEPSSLVLVGVVASCSLAWVVRRQRRARA